MTNGRVVSSLLCSAAIIACASAQITIPSISGALVIDGNPDDAAWQGALVLTLASNEFGSPFPAGGDTRVGVRGGYVCLNARIPEPGRLVAHSTGHNPQWWSEDLITWTFRAHIGKPRRNVNLSLSVNPFGAWRFQNDATLAPVEGSEKVLVAANHGSGEWTVEAAIPLESLDRSGFVDIERIRAPRPVAPELHWYWPLVNERSVFELAAHGTAPAPDFQAPRLAASASAGSEVKPDGALSWIPENVWNPEQRDQLGIPTMLERSLRARMAGVAVQEKAAWQKVSSRQTWESFRELRLAALRKSLEPFPERTPLRTVVTRRADYGDGFAIENIAFESRPNLLVTANLYLPATITAKIPAIIVVHSHHAPKTQSELQDLGMTWARSGTAVLVMDQLCAGERSQSQPWYRESYYGRYTLGNQLLLAGESLMKWMVWDLIRSVDVLLEKPYIDPKRVVMLGAVAGGGDPAAVTAALDSRIAAVIPFNFGEAGPEEHYTLGPRGYEADTAWPGWGEWETTRCMPRSAIDQFFPWMICASVAPRPFLYSFEMGWPKNVEHEPMWARYEKVFDFYRARSHLDEVHGYGPFPGPGECTNVGTYLRKRIYPILNRWLGIAVPKVEYHNPRPDSELMCLTTAVAAERNPKPASEIALELARARLSDFHSKLTSLPENQQLPQLQAALAEKLGDIEPVMKLEAQALWTKSGPQGSLEALAIQPEAGITLPVLLLKPIKPGGPRTPAVIAIAQDGKGRFLSQAGAQITSLLGSGVAVCLPDLRGVGELAATHSRNPDSMGLAATEFMLGRTMLGARLKDLRTVFRYLASRPDIDPARIALWGESFAQTNGNDRHFDQSILQTPGPVLQNQAEPMGPIIALLAALYEDRVAAVAAKGGLVSFLSVLEDRFSYLPQDVVAPGILEVADLPDIARAIAPRPLLQQGSVDGRNAPVDHSASNPTATSDWLSKHLR